MYFSMGDFTLRLLKNMKKIIALLHFVNVAREPERKTNISLI